MLTRFGFFRDLEKRMQDIDPATVDFSDCLEIEEEDKEGAFALTDDLRRFFGVLDQERIALDGLMSETNKTLETFKDERRALQKRLNGEDDSDSVKTELVAAFNKKLSDVKSEYSYRQTRQNNLWKIFFEVALEEWQSAQDEPKQFGESTGLGLYSNGTLVVKDEKRSVSVADLLFGAAIAM